MNQNFFISSYVKFCCQDVSLDSILVLLLCIQNCFVPISVEKVERTLINGEAIPETKNTKKDEFKFPVPHSQHLVSLRQAALEAFIG